MNVLLIGANGDIGTIAKVALSERNTVITAGRSKADILVDMADPKSVEAMYKTAGRVDAVVSTAGDAHFASLQEHTQETFMIGLRQKVMGQINLVLSGMEHISDGGSFTLTSGVLDRDPVPMATNAAAANGALGGFVRAAAIEMPRGQRINVVSPGVLEASLPRYGDWFRGHDPVPSDRVGRAYVKCVEGSINGEVVIVS
ncbi:short chain dehydrogenase [Tateyamaria omphalii]|uniref:short chain dehydrogenase n=1 Tax=Tateyamaria omphalii TaxID=299262 RepID=UPI001C9A1841|nr:short chain dehydrogenase [Tateyamaria omphalii]MBY5933545.1 short chain dehydrogenase [Tateyamaria omphalii]